MLINASSSDSTERIPTKKILSVSGTFFNSNERLLYASCVKEGFEPHVRYECASPRMLVTERLGVSVLPRLMAELPGPPISIQSLDPPLSRTVSVFFFEGRYLSPAAEILLQYVEQYFRSASTF
ncbi:LysR family transcriptional regulator substrate-binding protein [uncultured Brevibacillus sp.]|uniref:LysR family transcriptional regulator substrate-binding protein n=1 Tax=uncultured Brevibacillus sp. TaxID=169970 RepID=UPI00338F6F24